MKQATKMVLGAAAIVAVSAGVAGVTAYSMLKPEPNKSVAFNDVFQQNPNTRLAALDATQMHTVISGASSLKLITLARTERTACFSSFALETQR